MWTHVRSILACCSCGFGLSEVGVREIRNPQVAGSIPVAGSTILPLSIHSDVDLR